MHDLHRDGYALSGEVLTTATCERLASELPFPSAGRGGVRNLLAHATVTRLVKDGRFREALAATMSQHDIVKATLFDKTAEANWRVQWHQDRAIAVQERLDLAGYGPWSVKDGTVHVDPPTAVLEQMVAVRVHLDACGSQNGPLRVIPGSHRLGKLSAERLQQVVAAGPVVELTLPQGAMLLMRPLLVHSSLPALSAAHRRVLHLELAPRTLITPLRWPECSNR
jgi:hypothetical protein